MLRIPAYNSSAIIADWVELYVIVEGKSISKSKLLSKILAQHSKNDEASVDSALSELERRAKLYGAHSFYTVNGSVVNLSRVVNWRDHPEYVMCLIYSALGVVKTNDGGTKLFEQLSAAALQTYLGGMFRVLGHPAGMSFKKQLVSLASECFEEIGSPPRSHDKDRGVDVVGWKPLPDDRNSQIFVLLQCAAGKHAAIKKPIRQDHWRHLILWGNRTIPGMSLPKTVAEGDWVKMTDEFDLILDRPRLLSLTESSSSHDAKLRRSIIRWCRAQL